MYTVHISNHNLKQLATTAMLRACATAKKCASIWIEVL